MGHFTLVEGFLVILIIALTATVIVRRFDLPIILGYVLVGTLVGPNTLNWLSNTVVVREFAELGVTFLMFTIGLEFSLPKLLALRRPAFVLGGLQLLLSISITALIGRFLLNISVDAAIVIGAIIAMSSTAIVVKQLLQQQELHSKHGRNTIGILLFQDIAVIPILIFISSLGHGVQQSVWLMLLMAVLKGVLAIVIIFSAGRWLLKPLFKMISATKVIELFTLCVLFTAVGSAWLTNALGLSYALGAFLSGIMLAECEFKTQINTEIRPFRDLLLALFFISVGMLVDVKLWPGTWQWILLVVLGLMVGKGLLITLLCRFFGQTSATAVRTGVTLAQGSEFGFAILAIARSHHIFPVAWGQSILAALLISFLISPVLIRFSKELCKINFYNWALKKMRA